MKNTTYLLLGSNMGKPAEILLKALLLIEKECGRVKQISSIYETAPWGFEAPEPFLNQVICVNTEMEADVLLCSLLQIEKMLGRVRNEGTGYTSRTIDIDILFYNKLVVETVNLILPHPRLHLRKFTLVPLHEIAPDLYHPTMGKTISELLSDCTDQNHVQKVS